MKKLVLVTIAPCMLLLSCQKDIKETNLRSFSTITSEKNQLVTTIASSLVNATEVVHYNFTDYSWVVNHTYSFNDISGNNNKALAISCLLSPDRKLGSGKSVQPYETDFFVKMPQSMVANNLTNLTVSLWFYIPGNKANTSGILFGYQNDVCSPTSVPTEYVPSIYYGNDSKLHAFFWTDNNYKIMISPSVTTDTWHQVILTADEANGQALYLDGVPVDTKIGAGQPLHMYYNQLGNGIASYQGTIAYPNIEAGWRQFPGLIDDAIIYNRRVTDAEASTLYNDQK